MYIYLFSCIIYIYIYSFYYITTYAHLSYNITIHAHLFSLLHNSFMVILTNSELAVAAIQAKTNKKLFSMIGTKIKTLLAATDCDEY